MLCKAMIFFTNDDHTHELFGTPKRLTQLTAQKYSFLSASGAQYTKTTNLNSVCLLEFLYATAVSRPCQGRSGGGEVCGRFLCPL